MKRVELQPGCPIRAQLAGDLCSALGVGAKGESPVIGLCRKLLDAGYDPTHRLEVFRGEVLVFRIKSIGEGANLQVNGNTRPVFAPAQERRAWSPIRAWAAE